MLYNLFDYLDANFDLAGAGVFKYISFRAGLAAALSLIITITFGKSLINLLRKKQVGETIRDLGLEGQQEKAGTPTMGGLIIQANGRQFAQSGDPRSEARWEATLERLRELAESRRQQANAGFPIFVEKIFEIITEINSQGTPILLVEQNALMALDVAKRGYVMETGQIAITDDADRLSENEQVKKAYLGIA